VTRLQRVLSPVNWKYAIGELVLIIAGILIALAASGWSQRRHEAQTEIRYLGEIKSALEADLLDVRSNIAALASAETAVANFGEHLRSGQAFSDSARETIGRFLGGVNHIQNRGAYESLKARGLDLIQNDSIRFALTQLYEGRYRFIETIDAAALDAWVEWTEVVIQHFSMVQNWSPRDYSRTLQDPNFEAKVEWRLMYLSLAQQVEQELEGEIAAVHRAIETELNYRR
jgi:type II secretory pathway pseudopilin PulG